MSSTLKVLIISLYFLIMALPGVAVAQSAPDFSFESFAGTYYLGRDAKGVATLTVQEDMVVDFPSNGSFFGIKRALPGSYQGHSLNLKIISVTDATDNPVTYHVSLDGQGNRVIETGDRDITLSGQQTYRLKYQTSGVAAFYPDHDEFLIDVNGRGWQETFASAKAFIKIDKSFATNLLGRPVCYIGYQNQTSPDCVLTSRSASDGLLITAATNKPLGSHQALLVKLDFKKATFKQKLPSSHAKLLVWAGLGVIVLIIGTTLITKQEH